MKPKESSTAASELCPTCGLCCSGNLFGTVKLDPSDNLDALQKLGLAIERAKKLAANVRELLSDLSDAKSQAPRKTKRTAGKSDGDPSAGITEWDANEFATAVFELTNLLEESFYRPADS